MRFLVATCGVVAALVCAVSVDAACPAICSTATVYGQLPGGAGECPCTSAATSAGRTGPNSCTCGTCYGNQNGHVVGYTKAGNTCPTWASTDCSSCMDSAATPSEGSGNAAIPKTTAPPTTTSKTPTQPSTGATATTTAPPANDGKTPSSVNSSPTVPAGTSTSSAAGSHHNGPAAGSKKEAAKVDDSTGGMATWQVALIICSIVLVVAVATILVLSNNCRKKDNEDDELVLPKDQPTNDYMQPVTTRQGTNSIPQQIEPPMQMQMQMQVQVQDQMQMQNQVQMQGQVPIVQVQMQQPQGVIVPPPMQLARPSQRPVSAEL